MREGNGVAQFPCADAIGCSTVDSESRPCGDGGSYCGGGSREGTNALLVESPPVETAPNRTVVTPTCMFDDKSPQPTPNANSASA